MTDDFGSFDVGMFIGWDLYRVGPPITEHC